MTQQLPAGRHLCTQQPAHRPANTHCQTWPKRMSKEYGYEWCCSPTSKYMLSDLVKTYIKGVWLWVMLLPVHRPANTYIRLGQNIRQRSVAMNDVAICALTSKYTLSDLVKMYVKGVWLWVILLPVHWPATTRCQTWSWAQTSNYTLSDLVMSTDQQLHTVRLGHEHRPATTHCQTWSWAQTSNYTLSDLVMSTDQQLHAVRLGHEHRPATTRCQTWSWAQTSNYTLSDLVMSTDQQVHTVRLGQNICQRSMAMSDVGTCALGIIGEKHSQHVLLISQKSSCTHSILFHVQKRKLQALVYNILCPVCAWEEGQGSWMHAHICWCGGGEGTEHVPTYPASDRTVT